MPRSVLLALILALSPVGRADDGAIPAEASPAVAWLPAYYEGYARARREGKPICLYFAAWWSPSCRALEESTFGVASVRQAFSAYSCVRVDMDGDTLTPARFGVRRVPTMVLLDRDEKPLVEVPLKDVTAEGLADGLRRGYEEFLKRP